MERLKDIIHSLKTIRGEENLLFSDEILIDIATRIFNSPIHKQGETIFSQNLKPFSILPATFKQKDLMSKFNIGFKESITKEEAQQLIKDEFNRRKFK